MTTEEKLQHFYDVSVGEAQTEAQKMLTDYKKELDDQFTQHKKEKAQETDSLMKAETERASREINKALSASQLEIKRHWTKKQNELKESLFQEISAKIRTFMTTPEYDDYLTRKIREVLEFADGDAISIYLTPADADKADKLQTVTGAVLEISKEDFTGGIKAMIPGKNILIDNSFQRAIMEEMHDFDFDGGLTYE